MDGDAWRPDPTSPVGFVESDSEDDLEPSDLEAAEANVVSGPPADVLEADPRRSSPSVTRQSPRPPTQGPMFRYCRSATSRYRRRRSRRRRGRTRIGLPRRRAPPDESSTRRRDSERKQRTCAVRRRARHRRAGTDLGVRRLEPRESVAQFRADGVVAATPGSHGYAETIDGPLLSTAVEGVVVVPIAPFVTQTCRWVLPNDGVALSVERDQPPIVLCVDDRTVERISAGERVSITADGTLSTVVVPESADERG